ncbi:MAG: glycosyltransferase, partial [Patescibacteria group bacterium]
MRVIIIGGHLSPALSIIEKLPKTDKVLFIGRKYVFEGDQALSLEYKTIQSLKIPFVNLITGRLQRKFTKHTIPSLLKLPYGFMRSILALIKFQPDVVLSFGGYLSFPVVLSAFLLRIPIVIHEQTLEAGLANKILSVFAKKICISWETSRKFFPKGKIVLTGNP